MASKELLEKLNVALNNEVTTSLRYMLQAASLKGIANHPVREIYKTEVVDEIGHANYLADMIVNLGGTPKLAPDLTPPPATVEAMLKNDIEQEKVAVDGYTELAALAEKENLVDLKIKMEEMAAEEGDHAHIMQRLLG